MSTNQGQSWTLMAGGVGNPLIEDGSSGANADPATNPTPNGARRPDRPGRARADQQRGLEPDLLGLALRRRRHLLRRLRRPVHHQGLRRELDPGQHQHRVALEQLQSRRPSGVNGNDDYSQAIPIDGPVSSPQYPITNNTQGNLDLSLVVDPTDPSILYLGGFGGDDYNSDTGLIRVDTTLINDAHSLVSPIDLTPGHNYDLNISTHDPLGATTINSLLDGPPGWEEPVDDAADTTRPPPEFHPRPLDPFVNDATLYVANYATFTNNGANVYLGPLRRLPGRPATRPHHRRRGQPDDRAAAAHLRQRRRHLERPGQ